MLIYRYYLPVKPICTFQEQTVTGIAIDIRFDIYQNDHILIIDREPESVCGLEPSALLNVSISKFGKLYIETDILRLKSFYYTRKWTNLQPVPVAAYLELQAEPSAKLSAVTTYEFQSFLQEHKNELPENQKFDAIDVRFA